jgi:hypothetical protein
MIYETASLQGRKLPDKNKFNGSLSVKDSLSPPQSPHAKGLKFDADVLQATSSPQPACAHVNDRYCPIIELRGIEDDP